ncbi:alpha/beta hydrolase (plasmid) [Ruegeria conchae]|uniref:alpha/beta fold hydrolase n=1 Tax=Ruegeria conchae TaxID=981384 RepID=UPI0021A7BF8D|nr:alpha/beta hydrolase [Ruegeria conchae]UWR05213.1 alpha/beta hydrolase [Ruegeria conchae]
MAASAFLEGFDVQKVQLHDLTINYASAGTGSPILLLHGHPQTHVVWRKVAPRLVEAGYQVIAADLRGYGDSDKPESDPSHLPYSKRVMAADQIALMKHLGHETFSVVGHDRGGRVAHRLALDFPYAVERLVVLDIAPTLTMYAQTDQEFATRYFWWFFLIQPDGLPEKMIASDPEYFLRRHIAGQVKIEGSVDEVAIAEYLRSYSDPATLHAICEDYRAAASIDLEHDREDQTSRINAPLLAIWGEQSVVGELYDVKMTWQEKANDVTGVALSCGHAIPEEAPEELTRHILRFLAG